LDALEEGKAVEEYLIAWLQRYCRDVACRVSTD